MPHTEPILRRATSTQIRAMATQVPSKARIYADANAKKPKEYWDYENLQVSWGRAAFSVHAHNLGGTACAKFMVHLAGICDYCI